MDILFITQYFPPETGAAPERAMGFAKYLSRGGHRVHVVTGLPNHPGARILPEYKGKWIVCEDFQGISIMRTYVYANPQKKLYHRLMNFFSFAFSCLGALLLRERFDVLVLSTPPIFSIPTAFFMACLKGIPLVLDVRDLWPQAATSLGELNENAATRSIKAFMNLCYRKADQIVVVTKTIQDELTEAGIERKKIHLITNGVDQEIFYPGGVEDCREVYRALGCERKFIVVYAGVIGIIHGPQVIGEAARILKDFNDIAFVVIGDGVRKAQLVKMKSEYKLNNLHFIGVMQPSELLPYLNGADLGLSTLQDRHFSEGTIPVKIFSYMACQLPVVFAGRGEGAEIIREYGAGACVEPENPEALASVIVELKKDPKRRRYMGERGAMAVSERFSRRLLSEKLESVISKAMEKA